MDSYTERENYFSERSETIDALRHFILAKMPSKWPDGFFTERDLFSEDSLEGLPFKRDALTVMKALGIIHVDRNKNRWAVTRLNGPEIRRNLRVDLTSAFNTAVGLFLESGQCRERFLQEADKALSEAEAFLQGPSAGSGVRALLAVNRDYGKISGNFGWTRDKIETGFDILNNSIAFRQARAGNTGLLEPESIRKEIDLCREFLALLSGPDMDTKERAERHIGFVLNRKLEQAG